MHKPMRKFNTNKKNDQRTRKSLIVKINGYNLNITKIAQVANQSASTKISSSPQIRKRVKTSCDVITEAIQNKKLIYGVTTNFGGMANGFITKPLSYSALQENLLWGLKCSVGAKLPFSLVRAGMLIRANALLHGVSGIRYTLIERITHFLNANMTPIVREYGSIGASGDLIPLAQIAGAIIGLNSKYKVEYRGKEINALTALKKLNLKPVKLRPKEALAFVNGTSMMAGIAALCLHSTEQLFNVTLHIQSFYIQALGGSSDAFEPFVHQHKPHPGQIIVAKMMRHLLEGSRFIQSNSNKLATLENTRLVQDRYSIRCLPQFLGVIFDNINSLKYQIETEANSASDNPLINVSRKKVYQSGNFLGEYIGVGMDQLRQDIALMSKHLDVQIALLVTPEFSHHLPASLCGNDNEEVKFGLKGLQICGNSITPLLLHAANPIATLFPTHAEQYNQNISSQGFSSAMLTWQMLGLFKKYLAISLIFAIQAIDLKTSITFNNFNTRGYISKNSILLYEIIYSLVGRVPSLRKPFIFRNNEQALDDYIMRITADLEKPDGKIITSVQNSSM